MSDLHTATVRWQRAGADFASRRYPRAHDWTFDGGARVRASSSPHVVPVPLSDPGAVDPEEAYVAALASCHMLWFLDLAARDGWVVDDYEDAAAGRMGRDATGRLVVDLVMLRPRTRFGGGRAPDDAALAALHHRAHEACFLANSVRSEIRCEPELAR